MKSDVKIVISRQQNKYNEHGYDIELEASTEYKGELFEVSRGGYAESVEKDKTRVINALQNEINYTMFLRKKTATVEEV
ncbi:hypothetical protein, partial [Klebsiella pneumoniae]|uniref:hypothetical protein n=1 Tax=Klebsiella pneumoniae TaxID=573 RepID=UPI002731D454